MEGDKQRLGRLTFHYWNDEPDFLSLFDTWRARGQARKCNTINSQSVEIEFWILGLELEWCESNYTHIEKEGSDSSEEVEGK